MHVHVCTQCQPKRLHKVSKDCSTREVLIELHITCRVVCVAVVRLIVGGVFHI